MKLIQLGGRRGKPIRGYAKVDDVDYERLVEFNWFLSNGGYAIRNKGPRINRHTVHMHREILATPLEVDHIDGNKINNVRSNLRAATHKQNGANITRRILNKSGFKGVSWNKSANKWQATIHPNGQHIYLGLFKNAKQASQAYNIAALKHFKEFANINSPKPPKNK